MTSNETQEISLPPFGSITEITGEGDGSYVYYSVQSFTAPLAVYELNVQTGVQKRVSGPKTEVDLSDVITELVNCTSKDGTPVTMFVLRKEGTTYDGANRTFINPYGGFNVSKSPVFYPHYIKWINSGGVVVVPHLRGGSEYGEEWHRAGTLGGKQNTIDDLIAVAEHLVELKVTNPTKLALWGASNGGFVAAAAAVQRPDLFGAVICQVPVLDMIHYDEHNYAKLWQLEYGDPKVPEHFDFIYAYSPYHQVKDGVHYPAFFLQAARNDRRSHLMHTRKMAARLQDATISDNPVLLYVKDDVGHKFVNQSVQQQLEGNVSFLTFLNAALSG